MTTDRINEFVTGALTKCELKDVALPQHGASFLDEVKVLANLIPMVGGALAQEIQNYHDYKESEFFRKFLYLLYGLKDTTIEERSSFCKEICKKAKDHSGYIISGMVDRLDNINKELILANLIEEKINGSISVDDFFRLSSMLERIPYVDIEKLPLYINGYYDESGDTELLYATGVLQQYIIDANGEDQYVLSKLGQKLLIHGLKYDAKFEDFNNEKLIYATNSGWQSIAEVYDADDNDEAMFNYDLKRSK